MTHSILTLPIRQVEPLDTGPGAFVGFRRLRE